MNVYQKLNEVRKAVAYIKRGSAGQGTGVLYDEVVAQARAAMVEHGVIVATDFISDSSRSIEKKDGTSTYIYQAFIKVTYINMDDPQDKFSTDIVSHAMDAGDKATGKALTYAVKMSLVKVLFLETGINDESRVQVEQDIQLVTDGDIKRITETATKNGVDITKILAAYKIADLSELPLEKYASVMNRLEKTGSK